ncbi:hypothetical protein [Minwuia sp.]
MTAILRTTVVAALMLGVAACAGIKIEPLPDSEIPERATPDP